MRYQRLPVSAGHHELQHDQIVNLKQTEEKIYGTPIGYKDRRGMHIYVTKGGFQCRCESVAPEKLFDFPPFIEKVKTLPIVQCH